MFMYMYQIKLLTELICHEKSKYFKAQLSSADTKTVFQTFNSLLNKGAHSSKKKVVKIRSYIKCLLTQTPEPADFQVLVP